MRWFSLNGKEFSLEQLVADEIKVTTEFEKTTVDFCRAWLNGQQEFSLQTSGSTGTPKKIMLRRDQMAASAQQTIDALHLKSGQTSLVCLDTKYIAGQMMLVRSLLAGMNILATEPSSNPFASIKNNAIHFVALVPFQLEKTLEQTPEALDKLECGIIGGATISNSLKERIKKVRCALYATYGMTETISHIALQRLNGPEAEDYFQAFDTVRLRLDERGCLCIKADYLGDEIVTNDLIEWHGPNQFRWLGRIDNVINSGGVKIIPEKVESVIEKVFDSLTITNRFFIAGTKHPILGYQVTLFVEGELEKSRQDKIATQASVLLTRYEVPREIRFVNKFTETATGKINRPASLA
jgi:O-succinylbenzoic acid--CoA ligase